MKAIVQSRYEPPDVFQLKEVAKPMPKDDEALIKIAATSVTAAQAAMREGPLLGRPITGLTGPKNPIPGTDFAGEIEAIGKDVRLFKEGDQVFGSADANFGCYAEYKSLPEKGVGALAIKPSNMTYEEATAILDGVGTALPFLRDNGNIQRGQKVLINGASGGVGTAAIQLAKYYGAEVTGVCSTTNVEMVKSLGADRVIDYTKEDFTKNGQTYDIIFDTVGKSSFSRCKNSLSTNGVYLNPAMGLSIVLDMIWTSLVGSKKAIIALTGLRSSSKKNEDIRFLRELIEAGKLRSVIDRRYPLEQTAEAHRYVAKGHKKGNVVITLNDNNHN